MRNLAKDNGVRNLFSLIQAVRDHMEFAEEDEFHHDEGEDEPLPPEEGPEDDTDAYSEDELAYEDEEWEKKDEEKEKPAAGVEVAGEPDGSQAVEACAEAEEPEKDALAEPEQDAAADVEDTPSTRSGKKKRKLFRRRSTSNLRLKSKASLEDIATPVRSLPRANTDESYIEPNDAAKQEELKQLLQKIAKMSVQSGYLGGAFVASWMVVASWICILNCCLELPVAFELRSSGRDSEKKPSPSDGNYFEHACMKSVSHSTSVLWHA